ncbi:MAG TPA: hypothetical protein VJM11_03650 [Nevskiaceae bacterium]|nr:hypothetical protein [Nevskiaceae bacterium]
MADNPGMVIKIAADLDDLRSDLADATAAVDAAASELTGLSTAFDGASMSASAQQAEDALADIGAAAETTTAEQDALEAAVDETLGSYQELGSQAPPELADVAAATEEVETATSDVSTGVLAIGAAIGVVVAEGILALTSLAVEGVQFLAGAITDLVIEGSDIADVAASFDTLTASVGIAGQTLLSEMQAGLQGTMTAMELMKIVNTDINAGMRLGTEQYRLMTEAAFALANANGTDVAEALDAVNQAMLTGRDRALRLHGVQVDLTKEEERFVEQHRILGRELTATEKLEVARGAILDGLAASLERLGEQTAGVDEKVAQAEVAWKNFTAQVGTAINESGVLSAGLDALQTAVVKAFGTDSQKLVRLLVGLFNDAAIMAGDVSLAVIMLAEKVVVSFATVDVKVSKATLAIAEFVEKIYRANLAVAEFMAKYTPGDVFERAAEQSRTAIAELDKWQEKTRENIATSELAAEGIGKFFTVTQGLKTIITDVTGAMREANEEWKTAVPVVNDAAVAAGAAAEQANEAARAQEAWNKQIAAMNEWESKIKDLDPYAVLTQNLVKTLPALEATKKAMKETGDEAVNMSDQVRFAAETVERASVSWNEAMDLVRQGKGTMGGTVGTPTKPAGMTDAEFEMLQKDPQTWNILHGWDWAAPAAAGSFGELFGSSITRTTNINVSTVMGDKYEIARVVKDALADDWKSQGQRA